jgi:hypothetical protein
MKNIKIKKGDTEIVKEMQFNQMELKALHNLLVDTLNMFPQMSTYSDIANRMKRTIQDDLTCDMCNFYGVNDILNMEIMEKDTDDDESSIAIDIEVQSTMSDADPVSHVLFFRQEQLDLITAVYQQMKKVL